MTYEREPLIPLRFRLERVQSGTNIDLDDALPTVFSGPTSVNFEIEVLDTSTGVERTILVTATGGQIQHTDLIPQDPLPWPQHEYLLRLRATIDELLQR